MHRKPLLDLLGNHRGSTEHEQQMLDDMIGFVTDNPDCFERSLLVGHVTASAWIVNKERSCVLLIHHYKLDKWLQPGGHCDGDTNVMGVAMKEVEEETGLQVVPVGNAVFDVDNHVIPRRGDIPEHIHYDVRFLFEADQKVALNINHEIKDIRWVPLAEVANYNREESIMRMVRKVVG